MRILRRYLLVAIILLLNAAVFSQEQGKQAVTVSEDRNQTFFTTKVYMLKHVDPEDLVPFLQGVVQRNNQQSSVLPFYSDKGRGIVVNMATDTVKDVDAIVKKLDRPVKTSEGEKKNAIAGDGISRFVYKPKYGVSGKTVRKLSRMMRDEGGVMFYDRSRNMVYGKGSRSYVGEAVEVISNVDRPANNCQIIVSTHTVSRASLQKAGLDVKQVLAADGASALESKLLLPVDSRTSRESYAVGILNGVDSDTRKRCLSGKPMVIGVFENGKLASNARNDLDYFRSLPVVKELTTKKAGDDEVTIIRLQALNRKEEHNEATDRK